MASNIQLNAYVRAVLINLGSPKRGELLTEPNWSLDYELRLLPDAMATMFTGHSSRHWAPSVSAAMGVPKEQRDYLGRWQIQHGANDYVLTAAQVIHSIQRLMARGLLEGSEAYDEIELLEKIRDYALQLKLDSSVIELRHTVLLKSITGYSLMQSFPAGDSNTSSAQNSTSEDVSEQAMLMV